MTPEERKNDMPTNPLNCRCASFLLILMLLSVPVAGMCASAFQNTEGKGDANNAPVLPVDLIEDRPTALGSVLEHSTGAIVWIWDALRDHVFSWITPPTPSSLTHSVSKQDAVQLFKLLGNTGYALKEIRTDVGIIPNLSFKFGQSYELSDADYEYLESQLEEWERKSPGMYDALQRKIIHTIVAVNLGGEYQVSSLNVSLLPLPGVEFTMSTKKRTLGGDAGALLRAIQRVDHDVRDLSKDRKN